MEKDSDYGWTEAGEHDFRRRELAGKDAKIAALKAKIAALEIALQIAQNNKGEKPCP